MTDMAATLAALEARTEKLYESKARGGLEQYARYADDPVGFIEQVLHCTLWAKQKEICESVRDNPRTVVRSAHGMGKDFVAARLLLWAVFCRGMLAIVTAATERQLVGIIMRTELQNAFRNSRLPGQLFTSFLRINGQDRIVAFPSQSIDSMTGWHDERVLVYISEGQGEAVEAAAYDACFALCQTAGSRVLVSGNPVRPTGRFFDVCRSAGWHSIAISALQHPNIVEGRTVIKGGPDQSWIDAVYSEYGQNSDFATSRVHGEFPTQSIDRLVRQEWLDDAVALWRLREAKDWTGPVTIGVDIAGPGRDKSAAAHLQAGGIRSVETWQLADTMKTVARLNDQVHALKQQGISAHLALDAVGLGAGACDRLDELGHHVTRFNAANKATQPARYANKRAEAYWKVRQLLELRQLPLPDDARLLEELAAHEWLPDGQGRVQVASKDLVKLAIKRSPDAADAVAIAVASQRAASLPGIAAAMEEFHQLTYRPRESFEYL